MQQQATQNAQNFYGQSIGRVKSQVQNYRSQLEEFSQQVPEGDAQAQIQEMIDSYMEIESSMDQAAQDLGVEDTMNQAAEQTQQQIQQTAQGAAQQAQDAAGQVAGQAQDAAGGAVQQVQDTVGGLTGGQQQGGQGGGGQQGGQQQPNATQAAEHKAQELGVDLSQVQGSGAGGRITVRDVISAGNQ